MGFTHIHKIILAIDKRSLSEVLSLDTVLIDEMDDNGRTALSWAAQRGDVSAMKALLRHGASPNIGNGTPTLNYSAQAQDAGCILPLLEAGADVHWTDGEGQNALHMAAEFQRDLAFYVPLVESGIDVNLPTTYGFTPLILATGFGHTDAARYLLDNGAAINFRGQLRKPAVWHAVQFHQRSALELLWRRGADLTMDTDREPTIVHCAARHAHVETLKLRATFRISLPSINYLSSDGFTIPEFVDQRTESWESDRTEKFERTFEQLLESLILEDIDSEEFHDALEDVASTQDVFEEAAEYLHPLELLEHLTTVQLMTTA